MEKPKEEDQPKPKEEDQPKHEDKCVEKEFRLSKPLPMNKDISCCS